MNNYFNYIAFLDPRHTCNALMIFYFENQPEMDLFIHFLDSRPITGACVRLTLLYRSYWSLLKVRLVIMSEEEQPRWSDLLKRRLANSNKGETT